MTNIEHQSGGGGWISGPSITTPHGRRSGYLRLLKRVTAGTHDINEMLARLQEASKTGAHSDDVAAVRQVIWAEYGHLQGPAQ